MLNIKIDDLQDQSRDDTFMKLRLGGVYIWSEFARVPKLYSPLNQDDFHPKFTYEVQLSYPSWLAHIFVYNYFIL